MKEYEINEDTIAVLPINFYTSKVIELNNEYVVNKNAYEIMDESCKYYGSTYKGRLNAAKEILDCSYKIPILVEESKNLIFFPTKSSLEEDCCWINFNSIKSINKNNNKSDIIFNNNKILSLDISKLSLENQLLRSTRLNYIIESRKQKNN